LFISNAHEREPKSNLISFFHFLSFSSCIPFISPIHPTHFTHPNNTALKFSNIHLTSLPKTKMPPKRQAQVSGVELRQEYRHDEESNNKCVRGANGNDQKQQQQQQQQ
jgi:hypothetical protein